MKILYLQMKRVKVPPVDHCSLNLRQLIAIEALPGLDHVDPHPCASPFPGWAGTTIAHLRGPVA